MFNLKQVSPFQLVIIGVFLSFIISDDKDAGALNVEGNLIVAIGSIITLIAAQKEYQK